MLRKSIVLAGILEHLDHEKLAGQSSRRDVSRQNHRHTHITDGKSTKHHSLYSALFCPSSDIDSILSPDNVYTAGELTNAPLLT